MDYEVIAVNDGSTDETEEKLRAITRRDPRWKLLCLSRNFGHQLAVSAGLYYASGDVVALIDADLQDPPSEISNLLEK